MSFERVRVNKIDDITDRMTGEVKSYVLFDVMTPIRVKVKDPELRKVYEAIRGKVVMVPVVTDEYNGNKFWKFEGDGAPVVS